jgi:hypothetical protein
MMEFERAEELHSRFTHLLQPIRDLTKNWDVDVASQLEDYLEQVLGTSLSGTFTICVYAFIDTYRSPTDGALVLVVVVRFICCQHYVEVPSIIIIDSRGGEGIGNGNTLYIENSWRMRVMVYLCTSRG